jgi:hypothetical protein
MHIIQTGPSPRKTRYKKTEFQNQRSDTSMPIITEVPAVPQGRKILVNMQFSNQQQDKLVSRDQ